jgi:hypothetical protein
MVKTDASGTMTWNYTVGGVYSDGAYAVRVVRDGGYIAVGDNGAEGCWLIRLRED